MVKLSVTTDGLKSIANFEDLVRAPQRKLSFAGESGETDSPYDGKEMY